MSRFIQRHVEKIIGMLNGWDRLRLRGTFRWLANVDGLKNYLYTAGVLLKDFKAYAIGATEEIRQATVQTAEEAGRPVLIYPAPPLERKIWPVRLPSAMVRATA